MPHCILRQATMTDNDLKTKGILSVLSMFRPLFLALCFSLAFSPSAQAATKASQAQVGIAAVVNEDIITYSDIENRLKLYLLGAPSQPPEEVRQRMVEQVFMRLVDESLQMQEAKNLGITVDASEMEHALGTVAGQNNTTAEIFKERLKAAGVAPSTIEDQIRAELAWTQVVRRRLRPQITISEGEIDTELTRMERSSGKTEYRVAEIFISFDGPASEKNAREKAEAIAEEIRKGKPFSMLAREYSEAPGAATGGDLGWIEEGVLDSRLENALQAQRPGQLSAPIRADNGFHLLFLRDKRQQNFIATTTPPPAAVEKKESPAKADTKTANRPALVTTTDAPPDLPTTTRMAESLRLKQIVLPIAPNEAEVLIQTKLSRAESLRREITSCASMDRAMDSFNTEGTGDLGDVALSALPAAMQTALHGLPPETLSPPVRNDKAVTLLMICDSAAIREAAKTLPIVNEAETPATDVTAADNNTGPTMPAGAPMTAAELQREEVANRLGMQRLEQMAERYLRDLRATAYIDRRF